MSEDRRDLASVPPDARSHSSGPVDPDHDDGESDPESQSDPVRSRSPTPHHAAHTPTSGASGPPVPARAPTGNEADESETQDSPAFDRRSEIDGDRATATGSPTGGHVSLVGSGPGDPGLLTRRAWRLLEAADVVLHDSLTGDAIVEDLPSGVEVVDVGKRPPNRTSQDEINRLMVRRAADGDHVVRLKGGDPNVFGRGGEEAEYLAGESVPFDVVSGVSSVLAASGVSGIPLTHRERSSSLTVITGHQTPDKEETAIDWSAIAATVEAGGTLVILMGVSKLPENVHALAEHGVSGDTPVAMVERATWAGQQVVSGTLDDVVATARESGIEPPAVTIIGDVVAVRDAVADHLRE